MRRDNAKAHWSAGAIALASFAIALFVATSTLVLAQSSVTPEITSVGPFTVDEGATAVTTLTATDSDTATTDLEWSKTGGADADKFGLTGAGVLTLASAKDFESPDDADDDGSYEVTVQVTDGANTDTADLVVTLQNAIELTALTGPATVDYEENKAVRVATYSASSDVDNAGLTWSLSGDDAADFRIDEPGGVLRFDIDPVSPNIFPQQPDYEAPDDADADGVYKVTVEVGDGTDSYTLDVEVTVTDADEAGTLTLSTTRPRQGEAVTATLADEDGVTGTTTFAWERSEGRSDWVTIDGATSASFTPTAAETGHFLRATAIHDDEHGSGHTAEAQAKEVVVGKLLHSLAVTTNAPGGRDNWRLFKPTFDARTLHYAVGCNDTDTMSITLAAQDADARMAIDGVQIANPGAETTTTLAHAVSGESVVRITVTGSDGSLTVYSVHCLPQYLYEFTTLKRTQTGITEDLIMFARGNTGESAYLLIIDTNGVPRFLRYDDWRNGPYFRWFRMDDGNEWRFAYPILNYAVRWMVVLDQNFEVLDTVTTVAPLATLDPHDHWVLPNGNYLLMAYEPAVRDFSFLPFGTHSSADDVRDSAIQIRTPEGESIFNWNSYDHMGLEDCDVTGSDVHDYAHLNSLQMLDDGDIIASFRGCSKVLRIDSDDGSVVWRIGPTFLTEEQWDAKGRGPAPFDFVGDPEGEFGGQHAAWIAPNGNLSILDNGEPIRANPWTGERNRENGVFGRAVEYALDTENGEAIFLRDHSLHGTRSTPSGPAGHLDLLSNGEWLVTWGNGVDVPIRKRLDEVVTQVDPDTGVERWSLKVVHHSYRDSINPPQQPRVRAISLNPVALVDVPQPLEATVLEDESAFSFSTTSERPEVVVAFNRPVVDFASDSPSVSVTGATIESVSAFRSEGLAANAYKFVLAPTAEANISFALVADEDCDSATGGICTADGTELTDVTNASYTIPNLDTVEFEYTEYTVDEGSTVDITVTLSVDPGETVSIPLTTANNGGATADDYSGVDTSLSFDAGETSKTITFTATQDEVDDDDENVVISFGTLPSAFSRGRNSSATVAIVDDDLPTASVSFGAATYDVAEGNSVSVAVSLDNALVEAVTIPLTFTDGEGVTSGDYSVSSSVTFAVGDTSETVTFSAPVDSSYDPDETVVIGFGDMPDGVDVTTPSETTVTIADPNPPQVKVSFGAASYNVDEGGRLRVPVTLDADPEREVVVPFDVTMQNGATQDDIDRMLQDVTFRAGVTLGLFGVLPADDDIDDDGESFKLAFGALPAGVTAGAIAEAIITIVDNDDPQVAVSFNQANYTLAEGSSVTVAVDLSPDPERTLTIDLTTSRQGGVSGSDYGGVPSSLTFNSGDTQQTFTMTAAEDLDSDDGESVVIGFAATLPIGVEFGTTTSTTVTITDVPPPEVEVNFGSASYSVAEGASVSIPVTLDTDPERTVTVPFIVTGQNGASAADVEPLRSVTFQPGSTSATLTFTPVQDIFDDDGEGVVVGFGALPSGVSAGATPSTTVSIVDDDSPQVTVTFGAASYAVDEGASVTIEVRLSDDPERTVDIPIETSTQGGASGDDFGGVPTTVTFTSGETRKSFDVTATDDSEVDPNESVRISFGALPAGVSAGTRDTTTLAITDNDITPQPTPPTTTNIGSGGFGFGAPQLANKPPQFRDSARDPRTVPENSAEGAVVGKPVMAWDPENDALSFSLHGDDSEPFIINEETGQIMVGPNALLDFEAKPVYMVDLVVTDARGGETVTQVEIRLMNVELPGMAGAYDMANNHNELVEREEILAAAAAYMMRRLSKAEMVEITKLYFATAFPPIDFSLFPRMANKYDLDRNGFIGKGEVYSAMQDYFAEKISKQDMLEVVKAYYNNVSKDPKGTEQGENT